MVETPDFTVDLAAKRVVRDGDRGPADADRVADRRGPRPQPGQARHPAAAAPGGLGPAVRARDELPARLHGPDPPQARARPAEAALLHHRAGDGLQIQRLLGDARDRARTRCSQRVAVSSVRSLAATRAAALRSSSSRAGSGRSRPLTMSEERWTYTHARVRAGRCSPRSPPCWWRSCWCRLPVRTRG